MSVKSCQLPSASGIYENTEITTGNHTTQSAALVEFAVGNCTGGDICGWLNNYAPNTTHR